MSAVRSFKTAPPVGASTTVKWLAVADLGAHTPSQRNTQGFVSSVNCGVSSATWPGKACWISSVVCRSVASGGAPCCTTVVRSLNRWHDFLDDCHCACRPHGDGRLGRVSVHAASAHSCYLISKACLWHACGSSCHLHNVMASARNQDPTNEALLLQV